MENLHPLDRPPRLIRILTELERERLSTELYHLLKAEKIQYRCREHEKGSEPFCWCPDGACRFGHHIEAAQKLWAKRRPGLGASASRECARGSA